MNWIISQSFELLYFALFVITGYIFYAIWLGLESVKGSRLGIFPRFIICLIAIVAGWSLIGGMLGFLCRYTSPIVWSELKHLCEGPWISVVFFKTFTKGAKYFAIAPLFCYVILQITVIISSSLIVDNDFIFTALEGIVAILALITTTGTYFFCEKVFQDNSHQENS